MRWLVAMVVLVWSASAVAAKRAPAVASFESVKRDAEAAFLDARFAKAAGLYERALALLPSNDILSPAERDLRAQLVLSYYNAGNKPSAIAAYRSLVERFADFEFDAATVMPETARYFADAVPRVVRPPPAPASEPAAPATREIAAAPDLQPKEIVVTPTQPARTWHWYYLTPLGIGQYLAGSPVRGTLFLALEAGALAANIACGVLFRNDMLPNGRFLHPDRARGLQIGMDVAFFALIGAVIAAVIDAAAFEP
ncbi:MAG: bacterial transcriptional activator domain-containing protein [Deltaproteobacteria bacterium]|nr:bacterial transcriptional activator domain-containing protein [Deltaproteobacteria bacterium]